jgi:hypothetical protein
MSKILTRCRDAEMMGPVCDVISDVKPVDETAREMCVNAMIHNEPKITDEDIADIETLTKGEECCSDECCC